MVSGPAGTTDHARTRYLGTRPTTELAPRRVVELIRRVAAVGVLVLREHAYWRTALRGPDGAGAARVLAGQLPCSFPVREAFTALPPFRRSSQILQATLRALGRSDGGV